jgi:eukaryotic-like serine/threonine-protein kinase
MDGPAPRRSPPLDALACDWPTLSRLLDEALAMPVSARARWLHALPQHHAAHRDTLARLLAAGDTAEAEGFLSALPLLPMPPQPQAPPADPSNAGKAPADDSSTGSPRSGDTVGPYRLVHALGMGGMGSVWLAERADGQLRRPVALKLPHVSWVSGFAERLARERDILATLDHPGIARLHDAGVDGFGRPWLALEFVHGPAIDQACRERQLSLRERVGLVLQVCDAVAYAHSRLVIHRDIKPGNILVTASGQARLLDFGIAKLVQPTGPLATAPALTERAGVALTVGYASPEQVRNELLSTASDVFSLGVVAYELFTGRLPWRADSALAFERAMAEGPPPLASRVAAAVVDAAAATDSAAAAELRGDLDAVLERALQPELAARYAHVDDFAADLRAWLAGEPVAARRRARAEQLRHWVRRHHVAVLAAAMVVLALTVGITTATWQALRAREEAAIAAAEADRARKEAARASATQALLNRIFQLNSVDQPDPQKAQRTTVRELLDLAARSVDDMMKDTPEAQVELLGTLSGLYSQLGANTEAVRTARQRVAAARASLAADDPRRADALLQLASRLHDTPERPLARSLIDEAEQVLGRAGAAAAPLQGALALQRARHERWGRIDIGLAHAEEAVAWFAQHEPQSAQRSAALYFAAVLADATGQPARGLHHLDQARALAEARGAIGGRALMVAVAERGDLLVRLGRWAEADAAFAEAEATAARLLGPDHTSTLVTAIARARHLVDTGRVREGEALWADVQARIDAHQPPLQSWWKDYARSLMLRLAVLRGRPDLAEPEARAGVARALETVPDSVVLVSRRLLLAEVLLARGRPDEAEPELAAAIATWAHCGAGVVGPTPIDETLLRLRAQLLLQRGDAHAALRLLDSARRNRALAADAPDRGEVMRLVLRSHALRMQGDALAARDAALAAEAEMKRLPPPLRWPAQEADAALALGLALREGAGRGEDTSATRRAQAAAALRAAVAERRAFDLPGSLWLARAEAALAGR